MLKTSFGFKTWFIYQMKYPEVLFMLGIREMVQCHRTSVIMQLAHQSLPMPGLLLRCFWTAASGVDSCASGRIGVFPKISSLAFHLILFCYKKNGCYFCISGCNIPKKLWSFYFSSAIVHVCLLKKNSAILPEEYFCLLNISSWVGEHVCHGTSYYSSLPLQTGKIELHCTLPIIQLSVLSRGSLSANPVICVVVSTIFLLQATTTSYLSPASDILGRGSFFSDFSRLAV